MKQVNNLGLPVQPNNIVIEADSIKIKHSDALTEGYNEVKNRHNIYSRFPIKLVPDEELRKESHPEYDPEAERVETHDEWRSRVFVEMAKEYVRLEVDGEPESDEAYEKRCYNLRIHENWSGFAFDTVNMILKVFNIPDINREQFGEVGLEKVRDFCYNALTLGRVDDPEEWFFPRREEREDLASNRGRKY